MCFIVGVITFVLKLCCCNVLDGREIKISISISLIVHYEFPLFCSLKMTEITIFQMFT